MKEYERALAGRIYATFAVEIHYRIGLCHEKLGNAKFGWPQDLPLRVSQRDVEAPALREISDELPF